MDPSDQERIGGYHQGNDRGRPSIAQQIEMEEKIWPYFRDGISVTVAARETGLDVKTVRKYYKKFAEPRLSMLEDDFISESKINVESGVCALDSLILKERKWLGNLEELDSKSMGPREGRDLRRELRETAKSIAHLVMLKINLTNSPTVDLYLTRMVKELMDKIVP